MISGIIFVFAVPSLIGLGESLTFNVITFWTYVKMSFLKLTELTDGQFIIFLQQLNWMDSYRYTMFILFISLLLVICISLAGVILVQTVPKKIAKSLKRIIDFFEGVPDLLVIFSFHFFVITLYQSTGLKFLQLYGNFGHKPYVIPIVTISFLPAFFLLQFFMKVLEEEEAKDYVQYSLAKGLSRFRILMVHKIRNLVPLLIIQLRTSLWIILSNIFLLEYMFNIPGFTKTFQTAMGNGEFLALLICLFLFTLPLLIMEAVSHLVIKFYKGKESSSL